MELAALILKKCFRRRRCDDGVGVFIRILVRYITYFRREYAPGRGIHGFYSQRHIFYRFCLTIRKSLRHGVFDFLDCPDRDNRSWMKSFKIKAFLRYNKWCVLIAENQHRFTLDIKFVSHDKLLGFIFFESIIHCGIDQLMRTQWDFSRRGYDGIGITPFVRDIFALTCSVCRIGIKKFTCLWLHPYRSQSLGCLNPQWTYYILCLFKLKRTQVKPCLKFGIVDAFAGFLPDVIFLALT